MWAFYTASLIVFHTLAFAKISALNYLQPQPFDYFWNLNMEHAPLDKKQMRYYADYYEDLLKTFPSLREANGILGYCYHYLGDDAKAEVYFKKAIQFEPEYTWNYYNLASIYILQSRYQEAIVLLQKLQVLDPQKSLKMIFASQYVYSPLLGVVSQDETIGRTAKHLKLSYKVSYDLIQLLNQIPTSPEMEGVIRKMKMELYAF